MNRIIGASVPSGRLDFHYSGEQRTAVSSCYEEYPQSLLGRRPLCLAQMRRYYGIARSVLLSSLMALVFVTLSHAPAKAQEQQAGAADFQSQRGLASFYGKAHQGKRTASGSRFDFNNMTAAHPWLPFGTKILVTVQGTSRAVLVTITDRLPSRRRIIDLSREAAERLGIMRQGVAMVSLSPG